MAEHSPHQQSYNYLVTGPIEPAHVSPQNSDILYIFIHNNISLRRCNFDDYQNYTVAELSSDHKPVFLEIGNWRLIHETKHMTKSDWRI